MRALLWFLYGLAAYGLCLAALLYLIGFSGNFIVPRSVDVGASAAWLDALVTDVLLVLLFGVQHSAMARRGFKQWWTRIVPPVVERSTYVVATSAVLALLFWFWLPIPEPVVWRVDNAVGRMLLWGVFGLGWTLVLASSFQLDHYELFGLRQVFVELTRGSMPAPAFRMPLLYRQVRHPLYLGIMLSLWAGPVMTAGRLLYATGFSAYILIGIAFEERDLLRVFGERYRLYRRQVGMLVPRLWAGAGRHAAGTGSQRGDRSS